MLLLLVYVFHSLVHSQIKMFKVTIDQILINPKRMISLFCSSRSALASAHCFGFSGQRLFWFSLTGIINPVYKKTGTQLQMNANFAPCLLDVWISSCFANMWPKHKLMQVSFYCMGPTFNVVAQNKMFQCAHVKNVQEYTIFMQKKTHL